MNRKMPPVRINVTQPSSKSVLITAFKEAAQLNRRETQLLCIPRQVSGSHQHGLVRGAILWRDARQILFCTQFAFFLFPARPWPFTRAQQKDNCHQRRAHSLSILPRIPYRKIMTELFGLVFLEMKVGPQTGTVHLKASRPEREERRLVPSWSFSRAKWHQLCAVPPPLPHPELSKPV